MKCGLNKSDYHGEWDNMSGQVREVKLLTLADVGRQRAQATKAVPKRQPAKRRKAAKK